LSRAREQQFWDRRARALGLAAVEREAAFVAVEPLWLWAQGRIDAASPRLLLDLGCGRGTTTSLLVRPGRQLVGVDVALDALERARLLTAAAVPRPALVAGALEALPFADRAFDRVVGRFVLHHAESLERAAAELHRVLAPGGEAVFVETWGKNPLLRFGRDVAALLGIGFGSDDERPLDGAALRLLGRWFEVSVEFPVFTAFELANRLLRRGSGLMARSAIARRLIGSTWLRLIALDRRLERDLPEIRSWGWFVGLVLRRR
jgi:SAM-dependent methyltransferase